MAEMKMLLRRSWKTLFVFEFFYNLLWLVLFTGISRALFNLTIAWGTGRQGVITANFMGFIFNPFTLVVLAVIGAMFVFYIAFEIAALVIALDFAKRDMPIGAVSLAKLAATSTRRILSKKGALLIPFILLALPLGGSYLSSTLVIGFNIPDYITQVMEGSPAIMGAIAVVSLLNVVLVVSSYFVFHYFFIEAHTAREAFKRSWLLIRGKRLGTFFTLFALYSTITLANMSVGNLTLSGVEGLLNAGLSTSMVVILTTAIHVSALVAKFALSIGAVMVAYAFLTSRYFAYKADAGEPCNDSILVSEHTALTPSALKTTKIIVAVVITLVAALWSGIVWYVYQDGPTRLDNITIAAHRGASGVAPANTIPAFKAAIELNADYIELDVRLTKDGAVIVVHDMNLEKITGEDIDIKDITLAEAQKLDAGAYFGPKWAGTKMPTLQEVVDLGRGKIPLLIETKVDGYDNLDLVDATMKIIDQNDLDDSNYVISMSHDALKRVKELDPSRKTGLLAAAALGDYLALEGVDAFALETLFLDEDMISAAHLQNKKVWVWTVNSSMAFNQIVGFFPDVIITDEVEKVRTTVDELKQPAARINWLVKQSLGVE